MKKPIFWILVIIIVAIILFVYSKHKNVGSNNQNQQSTQPVQPTQPTQPTQKKLSQIEPNSANENSVIATAPLNNSPAPSSENSSHSLQTIPLQTT